MSFDSKKKKNNQKVVSFSPNNHTSRIRDFRAATLVEQIAEALKSDILNGTLKGGDQLLEDRLKNEFDVSRTPLREAIRVLEKEGLVEIIPRKGAFVRRISRQDIEENFPVRAALEGVAAGLAYKNLTEQDIDEMEEDFGNMREAAEKEDFMEYLKHHLSFHEIFIKASENETLISILENLRMHTLWHRYTYQYYKQDFRYSLKVHRRILDLLREKKAHPEEVQKVVQEHIEVALQPFLNTMEKLEGEKTKDSE